jgi:SNF2 family DNA or RNA helicase
MGSLSLKFREDGRAQIARSADLHGIVWSRLRISAMQIDREATVEADSIILDWTAGLLALRSISSLRSELDFTIQPMGKAQELVARDQRERARLRGDNSTAQTISASEIMEKLATNAWDYDKRKLKAHQERDLIKLLSVDHGANFSVPGAGKTTVGFALHLLTRSEDTKLLVVAPKNALGAWSSIASEVLRGDSIECKTGFVRLDGSDEDIERKLAESTSTFFVVTYDRIVRSPLVFRNWMSTNHVHLILDESHRIKAGNLSQRGRILGSLKSLAIRRDIMTGTPVPNTPDDLATQFEFLYPTQRFGHRIRSGEPPRTVIENLYVRTTKADLQIPPMDPPIFEDVPMSSAQAAFYSWLRARTLPLLRQALQNRRIAVPAVRGSVMRLLQASSNARWAAIRSFDDNLSRGEIPEELLHRVMAEGDSNKLLVGADIARRLVADGQRALIWTTFRDNIARLRELLLDCDVTFIDGSVPSGNAGDMATREGRIAAFHRADGPRVLVANPAACSEAISLHLACHDAIYVDRSYNGAHYLQSLDRIHRLGLPPGTRTRVTILQSSCDGRETVDHSVSRRLHAKLQTMDQILNDVDVRRLAIAEEDGDGEELIRDVDLNEQDVQDLIEQIEKNRFAGRDETEE